MILEKGHWLELIIEADPTLSDSITHLLTSLLKRGVRMETKADGGEIHDRIFAYLTQDDLKGGALQEIKNYLSRLNALNPDLPSISIHEKIIEDIDWGENWKKHFRPVYIGSFIIKPSWEEMAPGSGSHIIELDPGQAFGTGHHATTSMVLEAMEMIFKKTGWQNPSVLDVGTGTGILAIAARKLGAAHVLAVDIDETALEAARENMARNDLEGRISLTHKPLPMVKEKFDLIMANIEKDALQTLSSSLTKKLNKGGYILLSGILQEQREDVLQAYSGLKEVFTLTKEDGGLHWVCIGLKLKDE
jgi:ribosomal protein L11 methyltransferase